MRLFPSLLAASLLLPGTAVAAPGDCTHEHPCVVECTNCDRIPGPVMEEHARQIQDAVRRFEAVRDARESVPAAADAQHAGRPLTSPWCEPAPDGLPMREMADRAYLCLGATAAVMRGIVDLNRVMADATADEDPSTAARRLREASEHVRATVHAVEAGCPTPDEVARLSPASREQAAEWCARADAREPLPPAAGQSRERP